MSQKKLDARALLLLEKGLSELKLEATLAEPLWLYLNLMQKWNQAINLTAIKDTSDMVIKHLLDSLAIVSVIDELVGLNAMGTLLDVGSGGGLPGIPLAIARPSLSITLCESIAKKCAFLNQVKATLHLENITICNQRVEALTPKSPFDVITARAVATAGKLYQLTKHVADEHSSWCLMKSHKELHAPLTVLDKTVTLRQLRVPLLKAKRSVLIIR